MLDRNNQPRSPSGSDNEARRFVIIHEQLHPVRRPMYYPPTPIRRGVSGGGYMGEYDQTQAYTAGQTFSIGLPATISGVAVLAGLYGVPPAGTDPTGTWAGSLPANPTATTSFVDLSNPPAISAAPNDVFYARLLSATCSIL
jgi:hypothetical protein